MRENLTISVPEAGARLGLKSKDSAYQAAASGQIPTIRIGKLLRVPLAAFERMLDVEPRDATKLPASTKRTTV